MGISRICINCVVFICINSEFFVYYFNNFIRWIILIVNKICILYFIVKICIVFVFIFFCYIVNCFFWIIWIVVIFVNWISFGNIVVMIVKYYINMVFFYYWCKNVFDSRIVFCLFIIIRGFMEYYDCLFLCIIC